MGGECAKTLLPVPSHKTRETGLTGRERVPRGLARAKDGAIFLRPAGELRALDRTFAGNRSPGPFTTDNATRAHLRHLEKKIVGAEPRRLLDVTDWADEVPESPGVYALWDTQSEDVVYVGETASLRHRMRDLGRTVNHTCRKKLAVDLKLEQSGDAELTAAIAKRYLLSFVAVDLGRKELEEYLTLRSRQTLLNAPGIRLHKGSRDAWVKPRNPKFPKRVVVTSRDGEGPANLARYTTRPIM